MIKDLDGSLITAFTRADKTKVIIEYSSISLNTSPAGIRP